tara:strand:+ start:631 stop:1926 length:1296 start_codon:yes stop_codon:yes gene_type:complete
MLKFIKEKITLIKILACLIFSILIYLSFRFDLVYQKNTQILISFILIQIIIWWNVFFYKKKIYSIFFYNLFFIVLLNLITTPIFHSITFDVPQRTPNYKITKEYSDKFFEGMFSGKHIISSDQKGYRTNKKINYYKKDKNVLRIVTIGASTTEQGGMDNNKTWSNLLGKNLQKLTNKNVEVINVGMAGLRSEHHYLSLKRIKKYEPDLIIFMMGINDWNYHIINSDKKYIFPKYEIKYTFKRSLLHETFGNINKQIYRKIINKKKDSNEIIAIGSPEFDTKEYLLPQMNSLSKRKIIKNFQPIDISENYKYWSSLILNECNNGNTNCLFVDQPTAYKEEISEELKKRLWMTPPNHEYTLNLEDLTIISSIYNNWLKNKVNNSKSNFCLLSDKIDPSTKHLTDDCHFSENGSKKVSEVLTHCISKNLKSILN